MRGDEFVRGVFEFGATRKRSTINVEHLSWTASGSHVGCFLGILPRVCSDELLHFLRCGGTETLGVRLADTGNVASVAGDVFGGLTALHVGHERVGGHDVLNLAVGLGSGGDGTSAHVLSVVGVKGAAGHFAKSAAADVLTASDKAGVAGHKVLLLLHIFASPVSCGGGRVCKLASKTEGGERTVGLEGSGAAVVTSFVIPDAKCGVSLLLKLLASVLRHGHVPLANRTGSIVARTGLGLSEVRQAVGVLESLYCTAHVS